MRPQKACSDSLNAEFPIGSGQVSTEIFNEGFGSRPGVYKGASETPASICAYSGQVNKDSGIL
jgi:hypothetical protein